MQHPDITEIALWVLEPESAELSSASRDHLAQGCSECAGKATELRALAEVVASTVASEPSRPMLERAYALVSESAEIQAMVAELIEDTGALAGVRGEVTDARFLIFQAGDFDLHVRVHPLDSGGLAIQGQFHGEESATVGATVAVIGDDVSGNAATLGQATTDDLGEFALDGVDRKPFLLEIRKDNLQIRTPLIS